MVMRWGRWCRRPALGSSRSREGAPSSACCCCCSAPAVGACRAAGPRGRPWCWVRAGRGAARGGRGAEPCPCLCRGARRAREAPAAPVPRSAAPGVRGERRLRVTALTASGWKQRAWLRALRRQRVLPACAAGNAR